jgi:hypothetical protein
MMQQWCDAIVRDPSFRQQLDPLTGEFTQSGSASYSPCALVLYDYTWRLAGVRQLDDELHWNIRPNCPAAQRSTFRTPIGRAIAELHYLPHTAEIRIDNKLVAHLTGCARLITGLDGVPRSVIGIDTEVTTIELSVPGHPSRRLILAPNQRKSLI